MKNYVVAELEGILDEDKRISHATFSSNIEGVLEEAYRRRLKVGTEVDFELLDWSYAPIVQSGSERDLRFSAVSSRYL